MSDLPSEPEIPTVKPEPRGYKAWFFTWNNPTLSGESLKAVLIAMRCIMAKFQLEKCPTTGTLHFQGAAKWDNAMRMSTLTKRFPGIYLERLGDWSMAYGTKEDTRVEGPWAIGCIIPRPILSIDPSTMYPWQKELYDTLSVPCVEDRKVIWLWEPTGRVGKSALMKRLAVDLGAGSVLTVNGRTEDIAHAVRSIIMPMKGPQVADLRIVHIDMERGEEVPYDVLAKLKDGRMFSPKYESVSMLFPPLHVVVTANFPPVEGRISADRWNIIKL